MEKPKKGNNIRIVTRILSIVALVILIAFIIFLKKLNVLPNRYFYLIVGVLGVLELVFIILAFNKKIRTWILIVLDVLFAIILLVEGFGIYKLNQTYHFIDEGIRVKETTDYYYIMVNKDSAYEKLADIENKVIYFCNDTEDIDKLKQSVTNKVNVVMDSVEDNSELLEMIDSNKEKIIIINEATYNAVVEPSEEEEEEETTDNKKEEKYRVLDKIELVKKIEYQETKNDITTRPFIIYLSGIDTRTGTMPTTCLSDVNIYIVVNPNTRKILLIHVPRDYYIQLHGITKIKDKLTHAGMKGGLALSKSTMEDLLGYEAEFYLRVNFNSVINLVDALFPDGITIYNDQKYSIRCHTNKSCVFKPGNNKVNGKCALAFARERMSYSGGDRHRGENQEQIIKLIINRLSSAKAVLTNYDKLLAALEGNMETNFSTENITSFIQFQLDDMRGWEIETSNLNGPSGSAKTYSFPKEYRAVVFPDQKTIDKAKEKIAEYLK